MKKKISLLLCCATIACCSFCQSSYQPTKENLQAREDFQDRRFGLFIHWGIYSELGRGEWVMHTENIPYKTYSRLAGFFDPADFDAKAWVSMAKNAGMKYITITSRHHDGFSMFGTKASPYNIVDATRYAKDPLKALADECHRQGIKLFFYYSLLDWGRTDYGFGQTMVDGKPAEPAWSQYIAFMKSQLTELLTNYGEIAGIWFDGEWERLNANWHFDEIYQLIHSLQPTAMVGNNHHHAARDGEDFQMFEKDLPGENTTGFGSSASAVSKRLPLETCETMNNNWGFTLNDSHYKTVPQLVRYIVNAAGRNGNFLLNIGPMPNGKVQPEFQDTLAAVGNWLQRCGSSIYGTRGNVIPPQDWGTITQKGSVMYVHWLQPVSGDYIFVPGNLKKIASAKTLDGGQAVKFKQQAEGIFLYTNAVKRDSIDTIIELDIK